MFAQLFILGLVTRSCWATVPNQLVSNGNLVPNLQRFPSYVGITVQPENRFCGGLILNAEHILTAASCVMDRNLNLLATSNLLVRGGNLVLASTAILQISRIFVHQQYNPFNHLNDLAVLRLEVPINFATSAFEAAELNWNIVPETSVCEVPGWHVVNGQASQGLQYTNTVVTNRDMCNNAVQQTLVESMMCAAVQTDQAAVCESNIGGPMYCGGLATAILSNEANCGVGQGHTIYTQIRFHEQWISAQYERTDDPQPGPTPAPNDPDEPDSATSVKASLGFITLLITLLFLTKF